MDDGDIGEYTEQIFKMYGGPIDDVMLEFDDKLIGIVQDKFGEYTRMIWTTSGKCVASVKAQI